MKVWSLGIGSDRTLGRPKDWNGDQAHYEEFTFKFQNWIAGLPGEADVLLEKAIGYTAPLPMEPMTDNEKIMARGIASALKALIGGKALTLVRHLPERMNGFEMWRILAREYRPDTAARKFGMLERVVGCTTVR